MHQNDVMAVAGFDSESILPQKLTNMPTHNQDSQVTRGLDNNQDPNDYRVVYCEYKYNKKE